jgi:6-phosphogluconolactonase
VNGSIQLVESVPEAFAGRVGAVLSGSHPDGFSLFLSGGPTAGEAYTALADTHADSVDWASVDVYWGDERCVPLDSPDSNHHLCHQTLLDRVGPTRSDHPMYTDGTPEDAAAAYQAQLAGLAVFDVVHLGMGPDGHCASLFPGSDALAITDPAVLAVANRDPNANNPHDRITLTLPAIARARLVVFTVSGASKRDAFARLLAGDDLPAGRVEADHVLWLVDADVVGDTALP